MSRYIKTDDTIVLTQEHYRSFLAYEESVRRAAAALKAHEDAKAVLLAADTACDAAWAEYERARDEQKRARQNLDAVIA